MLLNVLILLGLFLHGAESACQCYQTSNYTGSNAPLSNAYNPADFTACNPGTSCSYVAYTGDNQIGWASLTISFNTVNDPDATLQIYDGQSANGNPFATINTTANYSAGSPLTLGTTTPYITVVYTQKANAGANIYYGSVKSGSALASSTAPQTTTQPPTTRVYNSSDFSRDPQLISHDLMFVINQQTSQGQSALLAMNTLASLFVGQTLVTKSLTSESQNRLGLATLTPYYPYTSVQGQIWGLTATQFNQLLPQSGVSIPSQIDSALQTLITIAFKVDDPNAPTRPNVQRTVVLFTADWPTANADLGDDVKNAFAALGVNLLIVGYNVPDAENAALKLGTWYNYINVPSSDVTSVASFVNPFFFNLPQNGIVNNFRRFISDSSSSIYEDELIKRLQMENTPCTSTVFQEPSDYAGPTETNSVEWNTPAYTGQRSRYCNFQNNDYYYQRKGDETKLIQATVYYELEIERDYLKFYADGVEIESFTGIDVSGATFLANATTLRATFTTDNKSVYRGFHVTLTEV